MLALPSFHSSSRNLTRGPRICYKASIISGLFEDRKIGRKKAYVELIKDQRPSRNCEKKGLRIYYSGGHAKTARGSQSSSGRVGVFPDAVLKRSRREPWQVSLRTIVEECAKMAKRGRSWSILAPPNSATAIESRDETREDYGQHILPG